MKKSCNFAVAMAKFINPFTDIGFKRIFGQEFSKPLLLDFLNNLLEGERKIEELTLLDKEQPALFEDDHSLIFDIFCKTDSGEKIIVEMQGRNQPNFKERSVYYASEAIARQGEKGIDWKYSIHAVYLVAFMNFKSKLIGNKFRTDVGLVDLESLQPFTDKMRLIYLQLPLFQKEADECENDFERWIYVLKNMETLNRLPWAAKSAVFQKLASISEVGALTREERHMYDHALKKYRDTLNVLDGAVQDGIAEGRAEGRVEGRAEGEQAKMIEIARNMKMMNMRIEDIAKATGLSETEIAEL